MTALGHAAAQEPGESTVPDVNRVAKRVVDEATGQAEPAREKNPAAVELGRLGGKARAEQMSAERRREIARNARNARKRQQRAESKQEAN